MRLTVLNVAYPFAPVSADPVGGAEQILSLLDRAIVDAGGRSIVVACEGSQCAGTPVAVPAAAGASPFGPCAPTYAAVRQTVEAAIARYRPDVVHFHGVDFYQYLPPPGLPTVATLHLPLHWYPSSALSGHRPYTWLVPVSQAQARHAASGMDLSPPIENGIRIESFQMRRKRKFLVALGRICPEKGFHHAIDAAKSLDLPLLLAGLVFPYPEHQRYFETEISPRLDDRRRWIGPVAGRAKRLLLAAAQCLVLPSLVEETCSLVAREALASGTPVVALRRGALPDAIEAGRTGILVDAPEQLADGIAAAATIRPQECRHAAERGFSARTMCAKYFSLYQSICSGQTAAMAESLP